MNFLPVLPQLGQLEILEVYVQYNGPRLFSCKNQVNKIFLNLWVDEEEEYDLWLLMLVSIERLQAIRVGNISLRQSFLESESSCLYELTCCHRRDSWDFKTLSINQLDHDCLPLENTFLELSEETLPYVETQDILKNAITCKREFLNITLSNDFSRYANEFSVAKLGNIFVTLQPLLEEIGIFKNTDLRLSNADIRRRTEFNTRVFSPGSFKVELASAIFEEDLFGNSIAGDALESFLHLTSIKDDKGELLKNSLATKKIIIKYKRFLESLCNGQCSMRLEWASPTLIRGGNFQMSFELASRILELIQDVEFLEEQEHKIIGQLFKMDDKKWKFGIRDVKTKQEFEGDVLESAYSDAGTATISEYYEATIIELPKLVESTNEIKKYYQLAKLIPYQANYKQLPLSM
jgi:hypothetical protein